MKRIRNLLINTGISLFGGDITLEDRSLLTRGISKSVTVQMASYLLVFTGSILFVRIAGVANYGVYVNIFNWVSVLSLIACAGMEDIVLSEIPALISSDKRGMVTRLIFFANKTVLIVFGCCALIFSIVILNNTAAGFRDHRFLFLAALVNIYFLAFVIVNQQVLQAFNRFYASQVTDRVIKPFLILLFLTGCWIFNVDVTASWLVVGVTIISFISAIIVLFLLRKLLKELSSTRSDNFSASQMLQKSGYFLVISLLSFLKAKISLLIIGSFGNAAVVGVLNIAFRISDFVLLPALLIQMVIPQLFSRHFDSDVAYKKKLFHRCRYLLTAGSTLIFLLIVLFGRPLLRIYHPELDGNYSILLIICLSQLLYSLFGPSIAFLMMQGGQRPAAIALLVDITVNCILLTVLYQQYQLIGVAWAALGGSLFNNVILRILVERRLRTSS